MSKQAQLDLRIIGGKKLRARRGNEGGADLAAEFSAYGNVLQIRIDRRQSPGCRGGGLKCSVNTRFGISKQWKRIDVSRLQLG